jgi:competence protein ComEA
MSIRQLAATLLTTLLLASAPAMAAVEANQASQVELETVKGIGPGLSGKIVAARQQSAFKHWSDLVDRVGGVGPGNAARFSQAGLTVAGAPYSVAPVATQAPTKPAAKPAPITPITPAKADRKPTQP